MIQTYRQSTDIQDRLKVMKVTLERGRLLSHWMQAEFERRYGPDFVMAEALAAYQKAERQIADEAPEWKGFLKDQMQRMVSDPEMNRSFFLSNAVQRAVKTKFNQAIQSIESAAIQFHRMTRDMPDAEREILERQFDPHRDKSGAKDEKQDAEWENLNQKMRRQLDEKWAKAKTGLEISEGELRLNLAAFDGIVPDVIDFHLQQQRIDEFKTEIEQIDLLKTSLIQSAPQISRTVQDRRALRSIITGGQNDSGSAVEARHAPTADALGLSSDGKGQPSSGVAWPLQHAATTVGGDRPPTAIQVSAEQPVYSRISLFRALKHSILWGWNKETVFEVPLTVSDHWVLAGLVAVLGIYSLGMEMMERLERDFWGWVRLITLLPVTFGLLGDHWLEGLKARIVFKSALRYSKDPAPVWDTGAVRFAGKFEKETGWTIVWVKDPHLLAQLDRENKKIKMSVGWIYKIWNSKTALSRMRYFRQVTRRIREAIEYQQKNEPVRSEVRKKVGSSKLEVGRSERQEEREKKKGKRRDDSFSSSSFRNADLPTSNFELPTDSSVRLDTLRGKYAVYTEFKVFLALSAGEREEFYKMMGAYAEKGQVKFYFGIGAFSGGITDEKVLAVLRAFSRRYRTVELTGERIPSASRFFGRRVITVRKQWIEAPDIAALEAALRGRNKLLRVRYRRSENRKAGLLSAALLLFESREPEAWQLAAGGFMTEIPGFFKSVIGDFLSGYVAIGTSA